MDNKAHMSELLRGRNLKATTTRLQVLEAISNYKKAIPLSKIQNELHDFDRVTLYRTIQILMENGIIHKALTEEKETFYALCSTSCSSHLHNHNHIHFKCSQCHAVTCVQANTPISFTIPGHTIETFEIEVTGKCISCSS